ncbi:sensor histidine kinase [Methylophaga lonarensis MPL]|uniref:histidine kinase n=1 Tax=Methylophaga lonarensis MPL TaxID=1286106 RepID=M7NYX8_9GAMM|nr:PAS domain-containing sensor histidine kinase [Methylophaga lonarensis]EMR14043.1 sensor histidine kinase [Methylophaga lonarensis MPL]
MIQRRTALQGTEHSFLMLSMLLVLGVFVTDMLTPLGFAHGILYSPILLLAARSQHFWQLDICFYSALLLIWTAFVALPVDAQTNASMIYIIGNRILSSIALVAVFMLCRQAMKRRQQLLRQQQQLQQAQELAHLGYWQFNPQDQMFELNTLAMSILECDSPQLSFKHFTQLFCNQSQIRLEQALADCLLQQDRFDVELLLTTKDGTNKWLRLAAQLDVAESGSVHGTLLDISSSRTAEIIADEAENRLHYLLDNFQVFVWTATPDGSLDYVSNTVSRLTGKDTEFILDNWLTFLAPEDQQATAERWQYSLTTGTPYATEFRLRNEDGRYIWHQVKANPSRDSDGNIVKWFGSAMDIDAIKKLQQHSEALARQLQNTLESITDGFFSLDHELRFAYVNEQAASMLGHPKKALLKNVRWQDCMIDDEAFLPAFNRTLAEQSVEEFEAFLPSAQLWLAIKTYPSAEGLTVYLRNITRQRQEQEELKLLRSAISQLNDIVMITKATSIDPPGPEIIFVNEAFERITGFSHREVIGQSPRLLQGPKTERAELDRIRHALENWQPVRARLTDYTKDKRELMLELNIVPIIDADGVPTHWVSVERDITEEVQLQQQLFQSQRMEAIGQLTGGIAHDFNNLLTVVSGNSEVLLELLDQQPQLHEMVKLIAQAADRGAKLTQSLLAYARKQPLSPQSTDIRQLVQHSADLLRSSIGSTVSLKLELPEQTWPVMIDPVQLESSLLNLCLNARAAMPGGGQLSIATENIQRHSDNHRTLPALTPGDYVCLSVSDTGQGIDKKHIDKIFEPFFTTKAVGEGTGLGLSMVYGFVRQSGGHISVQSSPGQGSVFKLYLPRARYLPTTAVSDKMTVNASRAVILLVEDDSMVRNFASHQLESAGHKVISTADATEALQLLKSHSDIELVFTDLQMPGQINGLQLVQTLQQTRPDLPVLLTTGFNNTSVGAELSSFSHYRMLKKPYSRDTLLGTVSELLTSVTDSQG